MQQLWKLFWIFFRIGAFTFGGGYVMIPIIQHEISEKYHLIPEEELAEILIIAQSLPGVMAVNAATSVGYRENRCHYLCIGRSAAFFFDYYIPGELNFEV